MSRLTKEIKPNDQSVYLEPGLDWQAGQKIGFAPSNMRYWQHDFAIIVTYDKVSGLTTLDRKLTYYQYGASQSTAEQYSGIDMRGEVYLLSRNIIIQGEDKDEWGCQILTSSLVEGFGQIRRGQTFFDHVEISNCSQYGTV